MRRRRRLGVWPLVVCATALAVPAGAAAPRCRPDEEAVRRGTWTTTAVTGIRGAPSTWRMDADAADPRVVLVADYDGVLVTRDGGCSWRRSLTFDEAAPGVTYRTDAAEIAGTGAGRVLYVLTSVPPGNNPKKKVLWASDDDGRTWTPADLPTETSAAPAAGEYLAAGDERPRRIHLLTRHTTGTGSFLSSDDAGRTWDRSVVTTTAAPSGLCPPAGPCTAPSLREVDADPGDPDRVWALTAGQAGAGGPAVVRSAGGSSWEDVRTPPLTGGPALMDVAPGPRRAPAVLLLGAFGEFVLSRDGGISWEAGEFPETAAGPYATDDSFDVADASGGRVFATLLGGSRSGGWAGNVMLLAGREWENVSPAGYAGYDRRDADGNRLTFSELTGSGDSFLMLSSLGRLATFRPAL